MNFKQLGNFKVQLPEAQRVEAANELKYDERSAARRPPPGNMQANMQVKIPGKTRVQPVKGRQVGPAPRRKVGARSNMPRSNIKAQPVKGRRVVRHKASTPKTEDAIQMTERQTARNSKPHVEGRRQGTKLSRSKDRRQQTAQLATQVTTRKNNSRPSSQSSPTPVPTATPMTTHGTSKPNPAKPNPAKPDQDGISARIQAAEKALAQEAKRSTGLDIDEKIRQSALPDTLFKAKNRFSKMESAIALSMFAVIVLVLGTYWVFWEEDYAVIGNADNIYNFGLIGGLMMLSILIYAVRKRAKFLRKFGNIRYWYYIHFTFGIVGPVLIVLHTSFAMRSINGSIAFIAMLSVVFSGFIGRYLYTRIGYGLRSLERDFQVVEQQLQQGVLSSKLPVLKPTQDRIEAFSKRLLTAPQNISQSLVRVISAKRSARALHTSARRDIVRVMKAMAKTEGWKKATYMQCVERESRIIREHLIVVANIATAHAFEKLIARWKLLHVPIIYFMLLSASAHVLAVHMY